MIRVGMTAWGVVVAAGIPLWTCAASLTLEQVGGYTPTLLQGDTITLNLNVELDAGTTLSNLTLIPAASGGMGGLTTSSFTPGGFLPGTASFQVTQLGSLQQFNLVAIAQNPQFLTGTGTFASFELDAVAVGSGTISVQAGSFGVVTGPIPSFQTSRLSYTIEQKVGGAIVPLPPAAAGGLLLLSWLGLRRRHRRDAPFV